MDLVGEAGEVLEEEYAGCAMGVERFGLLFIDRAESGEPRCLGSPVSTTGEGKASIPTGSRYLVDMMAVAVMELATGSMEAAFASQTDYLVT